jgi:D-3-phosphoglycerate dehydrogenase
VIIAIPDDYHGVVDRLDCLSRLAGHDVRIFTDAAPPAERLVANLREADIVVPVRERTRFTREIIARLPKLKLFSQTGRSTHHIDIAACTERGIAVTAGTNASPHTVAEHTWALILAALRRIPEETAMMKRGVFRRGFSGALHGRTLGVYGLGRIGRLVAATGAGFGMRVLVWGREGSLAAARAAGYETAASRAAFFEESDVLVVMLRLTAATRGIVTADDLARMKPTALLVNTARAELVAAGALEDALKKGRPGMAAVDVYENEPVLGGDHPLLRLDNALCTPHTAWLEQDTYELYFGEAFDNIAAFLAGKPVNVVNPEVLKSPGERVNR